LLGARFCLERRSCARQNEKPYRNRQQPTGHILHKMGSKGRRIHFESKVTRRSIIFSVQNETTAASEHSNMISGGRSPVFDAAFIPELEVKSKRT
jgi:hypothetical protein